MAVGLHTNLLYINYIVQKYFKILSPFVLYNMTSAVLGNMTNSMQVTWNTTINIKNLTYMNLTYMNLTYICRPLWIIGIKE